MAEVKLQPLRIPAGWSVSWNSFYEEDPCEENFIAFDGSSIFAADHRRNGIAIDMEYFPKNFENGQFTVAYIQHENLKNERVIGGFRTKDRLEMVAELERFMMEMTPPNVATST